LQVILAISATFGERLDMVNMITLADLDLAVSASPYGYVPPALPFKDSKMYRSRYSRADR